MKTRKLLLFVNLAAILFGIVYSECHHRDYGHGGTVCVCTEATPNCVGEFRNLGRTLPTKGVASSYRSSRTGERLEAGQYHFGKDEPKTPHIIRVNVDPSKKGQKILGFGGAFTDSASYNILQMSKALQARIMEDYFGEDGIGYRVMRVPIGSTDFSLRAYSLDDVENDDTLAHFALAKEDVEYKIPLMKIANQLTNNTVKYFASAWSSPAWMKDNKQYNHGGFLLGTPGTKYYKMYAKYLVKFLEEYQKNSIPFWGLTVLNEPGQGWNKGIAYNSLGLNATGQREFVKLDLGPELATAGLGPDKIKLMVHDDNTPNMDKVIDEILQDKDAAKFISGVAYHWYSNSGDHQNPILDRVAQKHPDYFLLATEACTLSAIQLGSWDRAQNYAFDIINDLNHHTVGWVEWNLALDYKGGPSWVHNNFDDTLIINATAGEYYRQPTFYAMAAFSKFIPPESVWLSHEVVWDANHVDRNVVVTVFERPDKSKVAVLLNRGAAPVRLHLHDPAEGFLEFDVTANAIETLVWH